MYTSTLTLTLPAALAEIAAKVGKAMDPDVGGEKSFHLSEDELTITTTTPCTEEFAAQAQAMLTDLALLHSVVAQDYATRWPDLTAPTLQECEAFVAGVIA